MKAKIAILDGDGIGPEIMAAAEKVLHEIEKRFHHCFELIHADFGGRALDTCGNPFPPTTKKICDDAHAILKGPVGGPEYENIKKPALKPEVGGVLELRKRYDTFANYRPVILPSELMFLSPLKADISKNIDILMIRELVGGIYFGEKKIITKNKNRFAYDVMEYSEEQIKRIARIAFNEARKRKKILHNIHKANVLECSKLWNSIVDELNKTDYQDIKVLHMLVDNASYQLVINPWQFDVMLMENMMGDIISDIGGGIIGSLGLMPSACIGPKKAYYEPSHGSAPDIAGKGIANPFSMIGCVALMLEKSFGLKNEANAVWKALFATMRKGYLTEDLYKIVKSKNIEKKINYKKVNTQSFGDAVIENI